MANIYFVNIEINILYLKHLMKKKEAKELIYYQSILDAHRQSSFEKDNALLSISI